MVLSASNADASFVRHLMSNMVKSLESHGTLLCLTYDPVWISLRRTALSKSRTSSERKGDPEPCVCWLLEYCHLLLTFSLRKKALAPVRAQSIAPCDRLTLPFRPPLFKLSCARSWAVTR